MPEGDTIAKLAARIRARFRGRRVLATVTRDPRLVGFDATGASLVDAVAHGKYLLMRFDDGRTLFSHLRLDGSWSVGRQPRSATWKRQVEFEFDNGPLVAVDITELGVVDADDESTVVGALGPDLCGPTAPEFSMVAERLAATGDRPIAAALLDQRVVAGFGNVFAVEVPFIVGVSPFSPAGSMTGLAFLAAVGTELIRWSAAGNPRNTTGRRLRSTDAFIYRSSTGRCPECGARLDTEGADVSPSGRSTWWCPRCQTTGDVDRRRALALLRLHPVRANLEGLP